MTRDNSMRQVSVLPKAPALRTCGIAVRTPGRRWAAALASMVALAAPAPALASIDATAQAALVRTAGDPRATPLVARAKRKKKKVARRPQGRQRPVADRADGAQGGRDAALPREIKREEALSPKKEVKLDENLGKTKDLKPVETGAARPTLTPQERERRESESLLESKIDEEIDIAKRLLDLETDCEAASAVRFRLADLYWEKSKRAFFKSNDLSTPEQERNRYTQQMQRLQATSISSYEKIVEECTDYKELPKVLYYLGKALMEGDKAKEGATYFKRIIKEYPDSEWVPHSWFMVGEYYFNVANDALAALKAYTKATEYPKSPMYGYSVYKQGWCYINTGEWEKALEKFKAVVTVSEDPSQDLDPKGRLSLRKEALKDYVRAYSNVGDAKLALKTFYAVGGKEHLQTMLEQLGNWYISRDGHYDVVIVYRDLIKNYPRSTRQPVYQGRIVDATSRMGDKKQTVTEAKKLTDFFGALRSRVKKGDLTEDEKKGVEKDLKEAEDIAENTLRRLAFEYYKESTKLRGQSADRARRLALDLHKHYLDVFPEPKKDAEVNYVFYVRFQYADILYKVEEFEEAAKNYEAVVAMNPHPTKPEEKKIVLVAAEEAVRSYDELVQDLDRKNPPQVSGTEPKPIPAIKQKLIDTCQRYIQYVGAEGEKIVEIRYKMARIYYLYNHFDQAAPAFNDIVRNHPANEVACYAANLVLDIYNGSKDYVSLKKASRSYLDSKQLACGEEDKRRFARIEESSSFLLIKSEYEDKKKYILAANAYLDFYKSFPKSEYTDDAVFNAAVNYDLGNKLDKANEVRRFLVDKMPICQGAAKEGCAAEDLVKDTLYNIAQSYERVVDFANAAQYLELFAKRFPSDKRSKDAVYDAALYRATLRDYGGGKAGRERFLQLYPSDPDVHRVAFAICESLENEAEDLEAQQKAGKRELGGAVLAKWEQAHNCYFDYIKNQSYVRADTDLLCQAQYRRSEIMRIKTNYDKGVQELKKYLLTNWPQWKRNVGVEKLPRCAKGIAEILLRDLEGRFRRYNEMTIAELNPTDAGKKKFEASIKAKTNDRDALIEEYKKVVEIGVAEPALTALYFIGEAYRDSIDALLRAPVPDKIPGYKLTAEDKQLLRDQLRQMAAPIEEMALEAYRVCVHKANELGVYNSWSVRALDRLHKLRPDEYPLLVERTESLQFPDRLVVEVNTVVIADGDSFKSTALQFKTAQASAKSPAASGTAAAKGAAVKGESVKSESVKGESIKSEVQR